MKTQITYTEDNVNEVVKFIGSIPPCPFCKGNSENCKVCNTTLIPFIDYEGDRCYLKLRETLEKNNGLHIIKIDKKRTVEDFVKDMFVKSRKKADILAVASQTHWKSQINEIKEILNGIL